MNIILIGFKSCGKTSVGQGLARQTGLAFVDTDTLIEKSHAARANETLTFREIYRQYGRDYFRGLEGEVVTQLGRLQNHVIAAGGGTFVNHPLTPEIRRGSRVIYLVVAPEILWNRLQRGGMPAFLQGPDYHQDFLDHFEQRAPLYRRLADEAVEVSHCSVKQAVAKLKETLAL